MKLVIQKVSSASVETEGNCISSINKGFLVLVGIGKEDTRETVDQYVKKMINLRIFADEEGKTNLSLADVNGEILLVSQFTLYANCKKAIGPVSLTQEIPKRQRLCMNTWLKKSKKAFR